MIQLADFEGVSGLRWGLLARPGGEFERTASAPELAPERLAPIARLFGEAAFGLTSVNLKFAGGKVLVRRGKFGLLILFCDDSVNDSMINLALEEESSKALARREARAQKSSHASLDSQLTVVHLAGDGEKTTPNEVVEAVLDLYAEYLGPLARQFARKDAVAAGLDLARLPARQWAALLNTLAARIEDASKRDGFLDRAVLLKSKF